MAPAFPAAHRPGLARAAASAASILGRSESKSRISTQRTDRRPFRRIDAADIGDIDDLVAKAHPDPATIKSCETHNLFLFYLTERSFFY
jgi:hypothetical protein